MKLTVELGRKLIELRFKIFNLSIIQDVPTEQFNSILEGCMRSEWEKTYIYDGFDAWIDYGKVILKKENKKLKFEWDNWSEGEIVGPVAEIEAIAKAYQLNARRKPKWWPVK